MRMLERTLTEVELAARACAVGALGGRAEVFSKERTRVRASVLPEGGGAARTERGMADGTRLRLLVPADVRVGVGDAAWVNGARYRVREVARWQSHLELVCTRAEA